MKRVSFPLIVAMLPFIIGLPTHTVAQDQQGQNQFFILPVEECNKITGANFQPAGNNDGVEIVSLDAGGLFASVGFQIGDKILSVNGNPTNDVITFCNEITSNKGKIIVLVVKDINQNKIFSINVKIPA